jgi:hypothetical protein
LIWAEECWDAPSDLSDPTAQLAYLAKNLTPRGEAEVKTVSGAEVVQHAALTGEWRAILGSEIAGVGHMTHGGPRRIVIRGFDPQGGVQLHLLWRALGSSRWNDSNPIVTFPVVGNYQLLDLGECRPQRADLGEERWEWKLLARMDEAPATGTVRIRDVYPLPTEQYVRLAQAVEPPTPESAHPRSPGTVSDKSGVGTVAWSSASNAKASDGTYALVALKPGEVSHWLQATNFSGGSISGADRITGVVADLEIQASAVINGLITVRAQLIKEGVAVGERATTWFTSSADEHVLLGAGDDPWDTDWTPSEMEASTSGVRISVEHFPPLVSEIGVFVDAIRLIPYSTEEIDDAKVCFAGRSIRLGSSGVSRQHPEDDVWGAVVPDGFLPFQEAGGLEERQARGILIASQGDLDLAPDVGTNKLSATVLSRDGFQFAREAAA